MADVGALLRFATWLILLALLAVGCSRHHSSKLSIFAFRRSKGWHFLERMNMQQGKMSLALDLKLQTKESPRQGEFPLQLVAIPEPLWKQEVDNKCTVSG